MPTLIPSDLPGRFQLSDALANAAIGFALAVAAIAVNLMLRALFQSKGDTSGDALKRVLENLDRPYYGVVTTYDSVLAPGAQAAPHEGKQVRDDARFAYVVRRLRATHHFSTLPAHVVTA